MYFEAVFPAFNFSASKGNQFFSFNFHQLFHRRSPTVFPMFTSCFSRANVCCFNNVYNYCFSSVHYCCFSSYCHSALTYWLTLIRTALSFDSALSGTVFSLTRIFILNIQLLQVKMCSFSYYMEMLVLLSNLCFATRTFVENLTFVVKCLDWRKVNCSFLL